MSEIDFEALQVLLDKQAITEILMRYSRAIDRRDPELLKKIYWPDATDDHLLYQGDIPGLVEFCFAFTEDMPTHHLLGNVLIEMEDGNNAYSETYYQAYHNTPTQSGPREDLILGGRYLDHFRKRDGEWRILQRTLTLEWYTQAAATSVWDSGMFENISTRGGARPDDPLYRLNPLAGKF